jgi:hypothetical protein
MTVGKPLKARVPLAGADRDKAGPKAAGKPDPSHDLPNRVEAINRALQSWNDQEVLRLMRLHWPQIVNFVRTRMAERD